MKRILLVGCALLFAVPLYSDTRSTSPEKQSTPSTAARRWPHELSDIKPDGRVTWGKLDNGLRYAIMPTKSAPTRGSLRMFLQVGSAMEADDQQGMAHFVEHMAFNGTKHFPAGETLEYFQRLGMSFGAHTNASTQIDHTVYQLELPRANEELTSDGLKLFRDFLDGMLLDAKEIDKERGVILSEQLARNTPVYRNAVGIIQSALVGTKCAERLPIGKTETIRKMTRERFVEFYESWYTPGRTVIVAVGDFDADMVETLIRKHFADAKPRNGETADPDFGKPTLNAGLTARFNRVPDASRTTVTLSHIVPAPEKVEDLARQRVDLIDLLIQRMMDQRLERLSHTAGAPISSASMSEERLYNLVERHDLSAECLPEKWKQAVALLDQELRRALQHGFTQSELTEAKGYLGSILEIIGSREATRQPTDLADEIVQCLEKRSVFVNPNDYMDFLKDIIAKVAASECDQQLRATWHSDNLEVSVAGNVELGETASEQLLAAYRESGQVTVKAPVDEEAKEFPYTEFGPAGKVVERKTHDDLELVQAAFANHVRVNVRPTKFENNVIRIIVRFGGGNLELPADKPGLHMFANSCFIAGGLKDLPLDALNRQIGGRNVGVTFNVGDDAFQLRGACTKNDLDLQLQLLTAYLTAPAFRAETAEQFMQQMDAGYAQRAHTLEGVYRYDAAAFLRSDDIRYVLPQRDQVVRLTTADVQSWLAEPLAKGYMEVTLVGDVDPDTALTAVSKTLGALPARSDRKPEFAEARKLTFPTSPKTKDFRYESDTPRAVSSVCWPTPGDKDLALRRRLYVLGLVLDERLRVKIREEIGATYTPDVMYLAPSTFPDYGFLAAQLLVEPSKAEELCKIATQVAAELATDPISDDEFKRVIQPVIDNVEPQRRENNYWLSSLADSQERPRALEEIRTMTTAYTSMKKADVEDVARRYLTAERATTLTIAPTAVKARSMAVAK
jgi:zinc protease